MEYEKPMAKPIEIFTFHLRCPEKIYLSKIFNPDLWLEEDVKCVDSIDKPAIQGDDLTP